MFSINYFKKELGILWSHPLSLAALTFVVTAGFLLSVAGALTGPKGGGPLAVPEGARATVAGSDSVALSVDPEGDTPQRGSTEPDADTIAEPSGSMQPLALSGTPVGSVSPDEPVPAASLKASGQTEGRAEPMTAASRAKGSDPVESAEPGHWETVSVRRGDSVVRILKRLGVPEATRTELFLHEDVMGHLEPIYPGQEIACLLGPDQELRAIRLVGHKTEVRIQRDAEGGWQADEADASDWSVQRTGISGAIERSFYRDALDAGLPRRLVMNLAKVFEARVDFARDVRQGDRFSVVYETTVDTKGRSVSSPILKAALFVNRGEAIKAVRYRDRAGEMGYFAPDGSPLRTAFLRTPVDYTRVSSPFNRDRFHPILKVRRPHTGVDLAAPRGRPIKAASDGTVVFRDRKGGYGKVVILEHGGPYSTLYAHMSRYARGLNPGDRVRRGEVIGYVGSTGLSTGPHLHYEFRVDGEPRDPMRVDLPYPEPLSGSELARFKQQSRELFAQLDRQMDTQLAASR